jgi:FkbM family methyltransferase
MTVLDVGAHAGFYTLLASACVGDAGRVMAFEPSPRERERLRAHLRLNRRTNVTVEAVAIGDAAGSGALFVFDGRTTGCNSFHLADTRGAHAITVPIRTLDDYDARGACGPVDLVKMDIEGAELAALRGAEQMFRSRRPLLLCELHDKRTAPWGYPARHIVDLVEGWSYRWLAFDDETGRLVPVTSSQQSFATNGVAIPNERRDPIDR